MVDYSKWENIELSDDEDELQPDIDPAVQIKHRHENRLKRFADLESQEADLRWRKRSNFVRMEHLKSSMTEKLVTDSKFRTELSKIDAERLKLEEEEIEIKRKREKEPLNVDTLSKVSFDRSLINKRVTADRPSKNLSLEQREQNYQKFVVENESLIREYGQISNIGETKKFLKSHPELLTEYTTSYLVLLGIQLEIEEQHDVMSVVAQQCTCLRYILLYSDEMEIIPTACLDSFFERLESCEADYHEQFRREFEKLKQSFVERAQDKIAEAAALEFAEEDMAENPQYLGPGGLDPFEVMESLPEEMRECFLNKDIVKLQAVVDKMKQADVDYHIQRCIDAGLWMKPASKNKNCKSANTQKLNENGKGSIRKGILKNNNNIQLKQTAVDYKNNAEEDTSEEETKGKGDGARFEGIKKLKKVVGTEKVLDDFRNTDEEMQCDDDSYMDFAE